MYYKILIYIYICIYKLKYGYTNISAKVIYLQMAHETADFTSRIFKGAKNATGMRQAKVRKNYAAGTFPSKEGQAYYSSYRNSVRDYFERQKYFRIPNSNDKDYVVKTVRSNYAGDKMYGQKWLAAYAQKDVPFFVKASPVFFFTLLAFASFGTYLIFKKK